MPNSTSTGKVGVGIATADINEGLPGSGGVMTPPTAAPATTINPSQNPNVSKSQSSAIQTQNAGLQQAAKDAQAKTEEQLTPPDNSGNIAKIDANNQQTQQQIVTAQDTRNNTVMSAQSGLKDLIAPMNAISAQIESVNKQIADLNTQRDTDLANVGATPGMDLAYMNGEQNRITRIYAARESGMAATASALGTQLASMQGNFNMAKSLSDMAVTEANSEYTQKVADLEWANTNFKDVITAMGSSAQQTWQNAMTVAKTQAENNNTRLTGIGKLATDPETAGAFQGIDWTKLTQAEADRMVQKYETTPQYLQNIQKLQQAKATQSDTAPASYKEWQLAGGSKGTGKTYAQFLDSSGANKPIISGGLSITNDQIGEAQKTLDSSRGKDGYVNTPTYTKMMQNWINGGGKQQDFFKQFPPKNYLNPNDKSYPSYIYNYQL